MLARNKTIYKWLLYGAAAALCLAVQGALLQRITLWGVIPFLYPLTAVIPATYESPVSGTIFALCVGVVCDLLLPEAVPCLYTLVFPLAGLCAALLSRSLLPAGVLCSLAAAAVSFLLTDGLRCFLLWMSGQGALEDRRLSDAAGILRHRAPGPARSTLLFRGVARRVRRLYD